MKHDGTVRNLALLERSGSTARVLNLNTIARRMARDQEHRRKPLFHNALLNRAIVIKHRLRRNEYELFDDYRLSATKIVIPISPDDLSIGAYGFFIHQRGYQETLEELLGAQAASSQHDREVLQILDDTPTLDPFVLREQFKRAGLEPSPHYFDIGPADLNRMIAFVGREIGPLVKLTDMQASEGSSNKLARKLLSSSVDQEIEPLRYTLKLEPDEYREGVFCWKGFLYYKWCLHELQPHLDPVALEISRARPIGVVRAETRLKIEHGRARLRQSVGAAADSVRQTLGVYDAAYARLVEQLDPAPFRQFLLTAPALFAKLGESLGAIQHIVSYWRYRFPPGSQAVVDPIDLSEIIEDFQHALQAFESQSDESSSRFERQMLA